ncbi:class I adenylate-forming enzyme family protein, partial [Ruminococcus sp.]|uniref:class I adenylate-forming enzyme family protein n=1 Tax=Ruminococcus sp. TaxID=41978 RepID=UPI0025F83FD1
MLYKKSLGLLTVLTVMRRRKTMLDRQTGELTGYPSVDKPWLKYYSEEAINAKLPECTIYEYMYKNNKDYPRDIAINYMGHKITYWEFFENIDKTAAAFLKAGVKEKEIVTVALPSIPEAIYCVYALNKIGAVANMIHPKAGKEETLFYFNEVKSRIAVIFDGAYDAIANDIEKTSVKKVIVASPGDLLPFPLRVAYTLKIRKTKLDGIVFQSWKGFIKAGTGTEVKAVNKNCHEMAVISHTGGTTGTPKGVMCSDENINSLIYQIGVISHKRQEHCLVVLPPFVNYSLVDGMLAPIALGIDAILIPDYKPNQFVQYLKRYKPNIISSIPAYWEALLSIENARNADYSCLSHIFSGGEAMNIETLNTINEILMNGGAKSRISSGLGCTEIVSAASFTHEDCYVPGSAGLPMPWVNCRIVEPDTKEELSYNEDGEICFSGLSLMLGYYMNSSETNKVIKFHKDGTRWLHTGDLGHIDENGVIFVTGRIKRIIMTKGLDGQVTKMFPDRIEKALYSDSSVELCCVIGIPDENRINYPQAIIVLKDGIEKSENIKQAILDKCKEMLPGYMVPKVIEFRDDLPRTPRGKVDY